MGLMKKLAVSALLATGAIAADKIEKQCGPGIGRCPESAPCCSEYGACGIGAYCLGGCDPKHSNTREHCAPRPVCKSGRHTFENLDNSAKITEYLGDASKHDWVYQGQPTISKGNLVLTMPRDSVGTVFASTSYVWYGKIKAKLRTSRGAGVVTAFILMSDVKDEIDYEWVGADLGNTQTNYYFNGIIDYHNSGNITTDDTFSTWHTYEVDWTPDSITWSVDGKVGRTKKRKDTYNSTAKAYDFPQTPSRVQLSLWPGGLETNGKGTIEWAGGKITWDGPDMEKNGYYYAMVEYVEIECYDPPKGANVEGKTSYVYTSDTGREDSISITDKGTVMKSFLGTGKDMDKAPKKVSKPSGTDTAASSEPTEANVETIPGMVGAGYGSNDNGGRPGQNNGGIADDGTSSGNRDTDGFDQGGNGKSDASNNSFQARGGMLALAVAFFAAVLL